MATKKTKGRRKKKNQPRQKLIWLMMLLLIPIIAGIIFSTMPKPKKISGPQFQNEGELQFIQGETSTIISQINIEIADTKSDQERGLMWRKSMEENQGMLFIMDQNEIQSFWMLNTYISLDLIFVDDGFNIVTIRKNTQPQSLDPVASTRPAKYVIEVVGGYSDRYGLQVGDRIEYKKN